MAAAGNAESITVAAGLQDGASEIFDGFRAHDTNDAGGIQLGMDIVDQGWLFAGSGRMVRPRSGMHRTA